LGTRHLLLVNTLPPDEGEPASTRPSALSMVALGRFVEVERMLRPFNIAPDGSPTAMGVLWGPGITIQMPMVDRDDPVMQLMVSLNDETIAWPVLERVCRVLKWKMMDPNTGAVFG
jgi:hypothetical protein